MKELFVPRKFEPASLGLIRDEIEAVRDEDAFNEALRQEQADGRVLSNIADDWERVSELFGDAGSEEEE